MSGPARVREGGAVPQTPPDSCLPSLAPLLPQTVTAETSQPWHAQPCFGPFAFYDVAGMESSPSGSASVQNKAEAHMVLCIYRELVHR